MGFHRIDAPYPWDAVVPLRERASEHPDGLVDLSIGTPVDPTPAVIQEALARAADSPGYPTVAGSVELREAIASWFERERGVVLAGPHATFPTLGSKELVALLPSQLGLGRGDVVVIPSRAYPTYEVGARLAGAEVVVSDDPTEWAGRREVALVWLNSPSNPTGEVMSAERMAGVVAQARSLDAVVASDECYAMLPWTAPWNSPRSQGGAVPSLLEDRVCGGDHRGLLTAYSLSKQSNLAGYRAAFVAGDPVLVDGLLQQRRHLGMMLPAPVQAAMQVALEDTEHVARQAARYAWRRSVLAAALRDAGFVIDHSEAGLYLWVRAGESLDSQLSSAGDEAACWPLMRYLADRGIVGGPGAFYGSSAATHVRISLTASDERIAAAAERLLAHR